jgi:uncharacterized protein
MVEFVFSFAILLSIVAIMSIGVMRGRSPISGSCGGLNNLGIDGACEICGGNPAKCDEQKTVGKTESKPAYYDAAKLDA